MVDVTIKNVPVGAEGAVKNFAMIAVEQFLQQKALEVPKEIQEKFETDVDVIRKANNFPAKYEVIKK